MGERTAAGSYWALTTNLLGPRAAAAGIAFINSVGNLGGFFGPIIMGEILIQTGKNYPTGLKFAFSLMMIAVVLCLLLRGHPTDTVQNDDNVPA
jgi:MFS transporter, ACS family, tartrate transporter